MNFPLRISRHIFLENYVCGVDTDGSPSFCVVSERPSIFLE